MRKKCLMRNVKNVTALLTRKQKKNAIIAKVQLEKKYKNMTVGYESILVPAGMVQHNNNTVYCYSFASFP